MLPTTAATTQYQYQMAKTAFKMKKKRTSEKKNETHNLTRRPIKTLKTMEKKKTLKIIWLRLYIPVVLWDIMAKMTR